MSIYDYPEGTTAVCLNCGESILLDQMEGGGDAHLIGRQLRLEH